MTDITAAELKTAIIEEQLLVQYQPKMSRPTGYVDWVTTEAEALVRWAHPRHGIVPPMDFLPLAVEAGLMPEIGEYVLRRTLQQLLDWRANGLNLNGCVNLDASLLNDPVIADQYADIVESYGLPCDAITFEVAQAGIAGTEDHFSESIIALRRKGFRMSLDDFGAAREALSAFGKLDFDEIKIHASLLIQARDNIVTRHALAAVTGMAHALGATVCAEGVEDQETFEFLKEISCDKMQGFFISEAVMPEIIQRCYPAVDLANGTEVHSVAVSKSA
ncbi:MAG: EAL domain-containing protein [Pseudomonadota bacterium]